MPRVQEQIDVLDNVGGSIIINRYDGGLNDTDSNEILQDNESIIRINWGQDAKGAILKVNGFTKKNAIAIGAKPIRGLFRVYQSDGTKQLLAICNGEMHYSDDDGDTFTQESGSVAFTETVYNSGVNFNDLFFFTNPTDNVHHYTPGTTTAAAATDQPTDPCKILLKRADSRMLAFVNAVNGSTLYFTKVTPNGTDADDWSKVNDAGSIAIDGAKSEPLTGGMTFGAVDIIFKDNKAFKVWGYPSPQVVLMPGAPGCASPYSVAQGDGFGFHLGHDGVWMYDGNKFILISNKIEGIIDDIRASTIANAFGVYRDGFYWLFYTLTGNTTNTKCIIYDVFESNPYIGQNIWYERDGLSMNSPSIFSGEGDDNEIYAGDSASTGFVYRLDFSSTGDDNGSKVKAINQTKYFNAGLPHVVKRFPKIRITYFSAQGDLLFNWFTDRGNTSGNFTVPISQTGTKLGTFLLGTSILSEAVEKVHTQRLPDTAIGKDISLKVTHDDTGVPPIIRNVEIEWEALYST